MWLIVQKNNNKFYDYVRTNVADPFLTYEVEYSQKFGFLFITNFDNLWSEIDQELVKRIISNEQHIKLIVFKIDMYKILKFNYILVELLI